MNFDEINYKLAMIAEAEREAIVEEEYEEELMALEQEKQYWMMSLEDS